MLKEEYKKLLYTLAAIILVIEIVFFNSGILQNIRAGLSLFWLYFLPGYFLMLYWKNLPYTERIFIGAMLSAAIIGISSYYLGLLGLSINYHHLLLPLILIIIGYLIQRKSVKQPVSE